MVRPFSGKRRAGDREVGAERLEQRLADRADVAALRGIEGRAVFEQDLLSAFGAPARRARRATGRSRLRAGWYGLQRDDHGLSVAGVDPVRGHADQLHRRHAVAHQHAREIGRAGEVVRDAPSRTAMARVLSGCLRARSSAPWPGRPSQFRLREEFSDARRDHGRVASSAEARRRSLGTGRARDGIGRTRIERITLFDVAEAEGLPDDPRLTSIAGNITDLAEVHRAFRDDVGGVFHLAAIVSANAEDDFDLGVRVNLEGTRNVLEACRALPQTARLVFASSVAVTAATCRRCSTTARS